MSTARTVSDRRASGKGQVTTPQAQAVFGADDIKHLVATTTLHGAAEPKIVDVGDLCDEDCQDCD